MYTKALKRSLINLSLNKQLSLLGLAMKAGKVVSGEFAVEKYVKEGKAHLVLVAEDASKNTKKSAHDMCVFYEVPLYDIGTKEELGRTIGKEYRALIAVTDENFAKAMTKKLEQAGS